MNTNTHRKKKKFKCRNRCPWRIDNSYFNTNAGLPWRLNNRALAEGRGDTCYSRLSRDRLPWSHHKLKWEAALVPEMRKHLNMKGLFFFLFPLIWKSWAYTFGEIFPNHTVAFPDMHSPDFKDQINIDSSKLPGGRCRATSPLCAVCLLTVWQYTCSESKPGVLWKQKVTSSETSRRLSWKYK